MNFRGVTNHIILLCGVVFLVGPLVLFFLSSTQSSGVLLKDGLQLSWGDAALDNYSRVWEFKAGFTNRVTTLEMLQNSMIVAIGVAVLTTLFSILTAYAVVFFRFRFSNFIFWLVLVTLLFPLESRFINTFGVITSLGLVNTHLGIILPVLAAALGTFFFRQFFLTLPDELLEAAQLDGAGPLTFFWDFVVPLSWPRAGAIFVISFMIGWNQYLWPLMVSTDDSLYTLLRGIRLMRQNSGPGMALVMVTILPPFVLLLIFSALVFQFPSPGAEMIHG